MRMRLSALDALGFTALLLTRSRYDRGARRPPRDHFSSWPACNRRAADDGVRTRTVIRHHRAVAAGRRPHGDIMRDNSNIIAVLRELISNHISPRR